MEHLDAVILQIYRAARELPMDEFQDFVLGVVQSLIPFDSSRWMTAEFIGKRGVSRFVHLRNEPDEMVRDWDAISHQDRLKDVVMAHPGRAISIHNRTFFAGREVAEARDYMQRYRHANTLGIVIPASSPGHWDVLSLWRAESDRHYAATERRLLERLMPHLNESLAHSRMHGLNRAGMGGDLEHAASAIARGNGMLCYSSRTFVRLLQEEWPGWKSSNLPAPLCGALSRPGSAGFEGRAIRVTATRLGELIFLRASRADPLRLLSPRETAVARLYGEGRAYKEIAASLGVAPSTIRNFLQRIYDKLEINDKAQLAALIARNER